ncbi:MAG TPA: DUF3108 domain-containing protein [candidate division Zixibacteria bacterium]|nr:DUF3108 domain-containing protein [candidate division Zixibacteria bacterium]
MKLKHRHIIIVLLAAVALFGRPETDPEKAELALRALDSVEIPQPVYYDAFGPGEELHFSVDYGIVNAGWAIMSVVSIVEYNRRPAYYFETRAGTNKSFSVVFKVEDRAESLLDMENFHTLRHEKHIREGNYRADRWFVIDQERNIARSEKYEVETYPNALDVLSAFYYTRMLELEPGDTFHLPNHEGGKNYPLRVAVHRKECIEVPAGRFDCIVIEPILHSPGLFDHKGNIYIWVTDDDRRMPVLMQTKIFIGNITASLVKYTLSD